jgi:hypothetical protein
VVDLGGWDDLVWHERYMYRGGGPDVQKSDDLRGRDGVPCTFVRTTDSAERLLPSRDLVRMRE